jgi:hypothetical protein
MVKRIVKRQFWQHTMLAIATATLSIPVISPAFLAHAQSPAAPAALIGQKRCTKQSTAIFSQRSATSSVVTALKAGQQVTLSEDAAQDGYIGVSAPSPGFVQTVNLRLCSTGSTPTPTPNPNPNPNPGPNATCRRVVQTQGLLVRQSPNVTSATLGSVAFNSQVFLTTNPATAKTDDTGRIWVQIAKPISGWISNGPKNTPTNLVNCQ